MPSSFDPCVIQKHIVQPLCNWELSSYLCCVLIARSIPRWPESRHCMISMLFAFCGVSRGPECGPSWRLFRVSLRRKRTLLRLVECSVGCVWLFEGGVEFGCVLPGFCLLDLSALTEECRCLQPRQWTRLSPCSSVRCCLISSGLWCCVHTHGGPLCLTGEATPSSSRDALLYP